jgi:hypothetical protein
MTRAALALLTVGLFASQVEAASPDERDWVVLVTSTLGRQ